MLPGDNTTDTKYTILLHCSVFLLAFSYTTFDFGICNPEIFNLNQKCNEKF